MNKKLIILSLCIFLVLISGCSLIDREPPEYVWCDDMRLLTVWECNDDLGNIIKSGEKEITLNLYDYGEEMDKIIIEECGSKNKGLARGKETLEYLCIEGNKW